MQAFNRAISTPITSSASFFYENSQEAEDIFSGSMSFNVPKNGTLVLEPGDTVKLHVVSNHLIDIIGTTKAAT